MSLELTQAAKDLLATRGFDPVLGARPLRRTIQREIEDVLAEKMLFGEVRPGQIVLVDVEGEGDQAAFTFKGESKSELPDLPPIGEPGAPGGPHPQTWGGPVFGGGWGGGGGARGGRRGSPPMIISRAPPRTPPPPPPRGRPPPPRPPRGGPGRPPGGTPRARGRGGRGGPARRRGGGAGTEGGGGGSRNPSCAAGGRRGDLDGDRRHQQAPCADHAPTLFCSTRYTGNCSTRYTGPRTERGCR